MFCREYSTFYRAGVEITFLNSVVQGTDFHPALFFISGCRSSSFRGFYPQECGEKRGDMLALMIVVAPDSIAVLYLINTACVIVFCCVRRFLNLRELPVSERSSWRGFYEIDPSTQADTFKFISAAIWVITVSCLLLVEHFLAVIPLGIVGLFISFWIHRVLDNW